MRPEVRVAGELPAVLEETEEPLVLVVHSLIPVERGIGTKIGRTRGRKSDCGLGGDGGGGGGRYSEAVPDTALPLRSAISLGDIHCAPTGFWHFLREFLNISSDVPKYRSFGGGGGYVYTF